MLDPLNETSKDLAIYITEIQFNIKEKQIEAGLAPSIFETVLIGGRFTKNSVEQLKSAVSDTRLLSFFGYSSVTEILGRPLSAYSRDVSSQLDVWSFAILNDIRRVIDALWGGSTISGIDQGGQSKAADPFGPIGNSCDAAWNEALTFFYIPFAPITVGAGGTVGEMYGFIYYYGVIAGRNYWEVTIRNRRHTFRFNLSDTNVFQNTGKHNSQIKQVKFQVTVAAQTSMGANKIKEFVTGATQTLSASETGTVTLTFGDAKAYLGNSAADFTMGGDDWEIIPDKPECPPMIAGQQRQRGYIINDFKLKLL